MITMVNVDDESTSY